MQFVHYFYVWYRLHKKWFNFANLYIYDLPSIWKYVPAAWSKVTAIERSQCLWKWYEEINILWSLLTIDLHLQCSWIVPWSKFLILNLGFEILVWAFGRKFCIYYNLLLSIPWSCCPLKLSYLKCFFGKYCVGSCENFMLISLYGIFSAYNWRHDLLIAHKEELGQLITLEQGKPLNEAIIEVCHSHLCFKRSWGVGSLHIFHYSSSIVCNIW